MPRNCSGAPIVRETGANRKFISVDRYAIFSAMQRTAWATFFFLCIVAGAGVARGQTAAEKEIAARFAPVFHQALGDRPRGDYITNFNFDGDWNGTNNWVNAENKKFKLTGYVYYSVAETATHYFIHYAVF